jgi:formamidopyrimidine-DNA glycosylase
MDYCFPEYTFFCDPETEISDLFSNLAPSPTTTNLRRMPELPDLQVFSRNLSKKLSGKRVEKIHAIYKKKLKSTEKEFQKAINGAVLTRVHREGKELHFEFDNGHVLGLHMMLKGELRYFTKKNEHKYTIIELLFDNGTGLAMTDFQGQATPTLDPEPRDAPDALSDKAGYAFLKEKLNASRLPLKKLLMDQKVIRGIGNAYADEILWHARISPFSISNKISDAAIRKLARSIKTVFAGAEKEIAKADPEIIGGEIRDFLVIHNSRKTNSPTGGKIVQTEIGGRKTYFTNEQEMFE